MILNKTSGLSGLRAGAGALAAALALAFAPAHANKKDDTLNFAYEQVIDNLDPYFNNVRIGVILGANVWDTLLYHDPVSGEYKGQLAKSFKQVDSKTLEFELREGIKFHNGEDFDADSVVVTLSFASDPKNKAMTQQNVNWIAKVEKLGQYKVRITSKEDFPGAKEYLSTALVMHPPKYYAAVGPAGMNAKPVGSGPYKIVDYQPGKSITLEKNGNYFKESPKGQPRIGKIVIRIIPDRQTQMAEAIAGSQDFIMNVPKDQAEQVKAVPSLKVVSGKTMRIGWLQMNTLDKAPAPQFKDLRVRQAVMHAIDRESMFKNLVGDGDFIDAVCSPSQVACTQKGIPSYKYDPARARQLLAEAGYPNGFDTDLYAYRDRDQAEAFINYLRAAGIRAKLNFMQYSAAREQVRAGKTPIMHQTWGSNLVNDTSASTPVFFASGADDINKDPEITALLNKGDHMMDPAEREATYKTAQTLIVERAYALPLWALPAYYVTNKDLDLTIYSDELPRFWNMSWK
jgi:peptide/nickel transport system substrate-binding protein